MKNQVCQVKQLRINSPLHLFKHLLSFASSFHSLTPERNLVASLCLANDFQKPAPSPRQCSVAGPRRLLKKCAVLSRVGVTMPRRQTFCRNGETKLPTHIASRTSNRVSFHLKNSSDSRFSGQSSLSICAPAAANPSVTTR